VAETVGRPFWAAVEAPGRGPRRPWRPGRAPSGGGPCRLGWRAGAGV